jgi:hypothetical protein
MESVRRQARREAGAQRTLYAVACLPWFGIEVVRKPGVPGTPRGSHASDASDAMRPPLP